MRNVVARLVIATGIKESEVKSIMFGAPVRYKTYPVSRPSGRDRIISQPTAEVKILQRALVRVLLEHLPVHQASTAYRPGSSVLQNALPHVHAGPILKMDFKDFFPSIRSEDWVRYCHQTGCLTEPEDILLTSHLLFHRRRGARVMRLAIGAPSSPAVSNALMFEIDSKIQEVTSADKITYTRYAYDLTFSAPRTGYLVNTISDVSKIIRDTRYPKLTINADKTTYVTKRFGRRVTGLTITNDGEVSIGRDNKRKIHAAVHRAKNDKLSEPEMQMLSGMLAYVNAVEPDFLSKLTKKYGIDVIIRIKKALRLGKKLKPHEPPLASN